MGVISTGSGGVIYAALFDNGLVKIGCTRNESKRMAILASAGPHKLLRWYSAVSTHYNLRVEEQSFHKLFESKRVHGEYFEFDFSDWLEWFSQWNSIEFAQNNGLLADLAQFYGAVEQLLAPDFLKAVAEYQPCNIKEDENLLAEGG